MIISTPDPLELSPEHEDLLINKSGIGLDVLAARGYRTVTREHDGENYRENGWATMARYLPALEIPIYGVDGRRSLILRPDHPRRRDGKAIKYENVPGELMMLDAHPMIANRVRSTERLYITEGQRKADSAISRGLIAIGLNGVWGWKGTNDQGGSTALADWESFNLHRDVVICFDSDAATNPMVRLAEVRLARFLKSRQARVFIARLPKDGVAKVGLDDFFVSGKTVEDLAAITKPFDETDYDDLKHEDIIDELNEECAYIENAKFYAVTSHDRFGNIRVIPHTLGELKNRYATKHRLAVAVPRGVKLINRVDYWNEHSRRRSYRDFDLVPNKTQSQCDEFGLYNLWHGYRVEPKQGDCHLFLKLVQDVIADGNQEIADYILDVLAYKIQKPSVKIRNALVLRSSTQGTGKGWFCKYFGSIFGQHFVEARSKQEVTGNFNWHLKDALVLQADEATFGGDKEAAQILKTLISESNRIYTSKGHDSVTLRNLMLVIITGNLSNIAHIESTDRRYAVFNTKEEKMSLADIKALEHEYKGDGPAALLHFLTNRQLPNDWCPHLNIPDTSVRTDLILDSGEPSERFIRQHLSEGVVSYRERDNTLGRIMWPIGDEGIAKDAWFEAYAQWCRQQNLRTGDVRHFFRTVTKLGLRSGEDFRSGPRYHQERYARVFPLERSRQAFAQAVSVPDTIWDGAVTPEDARSMRPMSPDSVEV